MKAAEDPVKQVQNAAARRQRRSCAVMRLLFHACEQLFHRRLARGKRLLRGCLGGRLDGVIDLEFGLGAGRTHADEGSALEFVIHAVALGDVERLRFAVQRAAEIGGIVAHSFHFEGAECGDVHRLERVDDGVHLLHCVQTGVLDGLVLIQHEPVFRIDLLQSPPHRLADIGIVADHLGAQHGRDDGVFVAGMGAAEISARLLKPEHIGMRAVLLPLLDLLADELEPDGRFEERDAEIGADRLRHARGNKGLDDSRVCGEGVLLLEACEDIVEQQDAHLVAGERDKLALLVLDGDAETVGIGIGAEHDVCMDLVCKRNAHGERLLEFGIGHSDGGELGILGRLLLDDGHVDAQLPEDAGDRNVSRAVYGRIDELQILPALSDRLRGERKFFELRNVGIVHFRGNGNDERALFVARHGEIIGDLFNEPDDDLGRLGRHLRAVLAVYLIAVVFLGIVRRGDHDARNGAEIAHRIREHGHGMHVAEQVGFDAVFCEHARRLFGEQTGIPPRIVRDDDSLFLFFFGERFDVFGEPLRRAHDGVHVHHVHAAADDAAHARRAEFELAAEAVFLLLLVRRDRFQLRSVRLSEARVVDP